MSLYTNDVEQTDHCYKAYRRGGDQDDPRTPSQNITRMHFNHVRSARLPLAGEVKQLVLGQWIWLDRV